MRAGLSTIQQTLTPEASVIINQSMAEAARRRHGQTTPLHVASALLASPSGLFRHACARSQPVSSHPLHCRALELCFSVALDRLPSSSSSYSSLWQPSISNALMAALKRAQAHQRRGCTEHHQLLAMKVELEQLIISILDDPSVSRVMREASFSSPAVKAVIQQCLLARPVFSLIEAREDETPVKTDLVLGPPAEDQPQKHGFFKRVFGGLAAKVAWQREAAAVVAAAVARCKHGGGRRRTDSWLLFLGEDRTGKSKMAEVLAELVFSAAPVFVSAEGGGAIDRLAGALRRNQSSVIVLEDVDLMEMPAQRNLKQAMERGCFVDFYGREIQFGGAVFVLLCHSSQEEEIAMDERASAKKQCLDLNLAASSDEEPLEKSRQRVARFLAELVDAVDEAVVFEFGGDVSGDRRRARRRNGGAAD